MRRILLPTVLVLAALGVVAWTILTLPKAISELNASATLLYFDEIELSDSSSAIRILCEDAFDDGVARQIVANKQGDTMAFYRNDGIGAICGHLLLLRSKRLMPILMSDGFGDTNPRSSHTFVPEPVREVEYIDHAVITSSNMLHVHVDGERGGPIVSGDSWELDFTEAYRISLSGNEEFAELELAFDEPQSGRLSLELGTAGIALTFK